MGVTIKSKNYAIDMGCGGFHRLRQKVAELTAEDIGQHYDLLTRAPYSIEARKTFFEEYDNKTEEIAKKYKGKLNAILDFLYQSDCEGRITYTQCKKIYEIVKDYDDDIVYGYAGRKDRAMFADFKRLLKDSVDNKSRITWY